MNFACIIVKTRSLGDNKTESMKRSNSMAIGLLTQRELIGPIFGGLLE